MNELVFPDGLYQELAARLLADETERCAILICGHSKSLSRTRLLVREIVHPGPEEYQHQTELSATLSPSIVARMAQRARREGVSLVFAHSHPFATRQAATFSEVDDAGEAHLAAFLDRRAPGQPHGALVLGHGGATFRALGDGVAGRIIALGSQRVVVSDPGMNDAIEQRHDRQIRAFGVDGQRVLSSLHVAVVGAGGTGSVVITELAHLGVGRLTIVDPDVVEQSNLNRVVGATAADVGRSKAEVLAHQAKRINFDISVEARVKSVLLVEEAKRLVDADLIFCCTDSHGSRVILNQLAYQYLIPMIDMGVVIVAKDQVVERVFARTQMLTPGLGCLTCGGGLDPEQVRRDFLTDFERQADPYILGAQAPQPAVISLNATIASLGVTMFLSVVARVPSRSRYAMYDALAGTVRAGIGAKDVTCIVCSPSGSLGRGDEWPLPGRRQ